MIKHTATAFLFVVLLSFLAIMILRPPKQPFALRQAPGTQGNWKPFPKPTLDELKLRGLAEESPRHFHPARPDYKALAWGWPSYGEHQPKPSIEEWFAIKETQRSSPNANKTIAEAHGFDKPNFEDYSERSHQYRELRFLQTFDIDLSKIAHRHLVTSDVHIDRFGTKFGDDYVVIHGVMADSAPLPHTEDVYRVDVLLSHKNEPHFAFKLKLRLRIDIDPSGKKVQDVDTGHSNIYEPLGGVHRYKWDGSYYLERDFTKPKMPKLMSSFEAEKKR